MEERGIDVPPPVQAAIHPAATLELDLAESSARADGRVVPLRGGAIELAMWPDGRLALERLDVQLGDMKVTGEDPLLEGIQLRDVRLSLARPTAVPVEWTHAGDAGFASLTVDLLLDWTLEASTGAQAELATQKLVGVEVELDVFTAMDGTLTAVLYGGKDGVIWEWAGLADIADLGFDLRAVRQAPVVE